VVLRDRTRSRAERGNQVTPERIKELRRAHSKAVSSTRIQDDIILELLNYIDTLQRDVNTYAKRDELIVGRMMLERDLAREESNTLRTQLAAENQRASRLDATCGELMRVRDTIESTCEAQTLTIVRLEQELAAIKTAHCCGECEFFHEDEALGIGRCGTADTSVYEVNKGGAWLCGHFKAKGTV
jgi:hypothetical protein